MIGELVITGFAGTMKAEMRVVEKVSRWSETNDQMSSSENANLGSCHQTLFGLWAAHLEL